MAIFTNIQSVCTRTSKSKVHELITKAPRVQKRWMNRFPLLLLSYLPKFTFNFFFFSLGSYIMYNVLRDIIIKRNTYFSGTPNRSRQCWIECTNFLWVPSDVSSNHSKWNHSSTQGGWTWHAYETLSMTTGCCSLINKYRDAELIR